MKIKFVKAFLYVIFLSHLSGFAMAGTSLKINSANYDSDSQEINLHGLNFDAFRQPTVIIGDLVLDQCSISPILITCSISGTPAADGGSFTVSVSGGNSPHQNEEIDIFILPNTGSTCMPGTFVDCYPGDPGQRDVGECRSGTQTCLAGGSWSSCVGAVTSILEVCDDTLDNDCDGVVDNGCVTNASVQIQQAREAAHGPVDILISGAYVTYLKPAAGAELAGFFIQAEQSGPALYIDYDPALLTPSPTVGDMVELRIRSRSEIFELQTGGDPTDYQRIQEGSDIQFLVQDISGLAGVSANLDNYESEVISVTGTTASSFNSAGTGHVEALFETIGDTSGNLYLRVTIGLLDPLPHAGCALQVNSTPLWRNNAKPQIASWKAADISTIAGCDSNTPPSQPVITIVPAGPDTTQDLLCNIDTPSIDVDGDSVTYSYSWLANGQVQGITVNTVSSSQTQAGDVWECMVTPNDGTEDGAPAMANVTIVSDPI